MAKTKVRKITKAVKAGTEYCAKKFLYSDEDTINLTFQNYAHLLAFGYGYANNADRLSIKIRLLVGIELLNDFDPNPSAEELLNRAHDIVSHSWDSNKKEVKVLSKEDRSLVHFALSIVHDLVEQTSLWRQTLAYKKAEDRVIPGANKWEYVLVQEGELV